MASRRATLVWVYPEFVPELSLVAWLDADEWLVPLESDPPRVDDVPVLWEKEVEWPVDLLLDVPAVAVAERTSRMISVSPMSLDTYSREK